ncbi:hypothetical protein [uncultured Oscillibacter sp.]|uniref:hypothetical protein n=1 Tax=uncultured Oscillibacter sp. TaxID=876091 RepID=UPI0025CE6FC1|nr:hypothetical protein [uncultured Oscillibacter sp.]
MSFADNLRQQANEELLKRAQAKQAKLDAQVAEENKKKEFFITRNTAICSGEAISAFYAGFKLELMELAGQRTSDESKHQKGEFVYLPKEFSAKMAHYDELLEKKIEYYYDLAYERNENTGREHRRARRSLSVLYYDTITPYKVFSKEECDIIARQLKEIFSNDGLRCSFDYEEVYRTIYEELEPTRWEKHQEGLIGYILKFDVNWHPWNTTKPISAECLEKIRLECLNYKNEPDYVYLWQGKDRKLLAILGLGNENIYLREDTTLFCSGKEGFAITPTGIYWVKRGQVHKQSYQELADEIQSAYNDTSIFSRIKEIVRADLS